MFNRWKFRGNNRSVMPLDVLGRTRATLMRFSEFLQPSPIGVGNLLKVPHRAGDRSLQLLIFNEEFLVSASHQLALITSLPFVHTARRYYRLNGLVRSPDWRQLGFIDALDAEKLLKLDHLEEVKVVTRFP